MIVAELEQVSASPLSAECADAMATACRAFVSLTTLAALTAEKPKLLASLRAMQARFKLDGHVVQAAHLADAITVLDIDVVPGVGDWDEETLEHEQFRQIDQAAEHLKAARDAHLWRTVMPVEIRVSVDQRLAEAA